MKKKKKDMQNTSQIVVARDGGIGSRYLMGTEFQFYKMKRVLEMGGGDGCTM